MQRPPHEDSEENAYENKLSTPFLLGIFAELNGYGNFAKIDIILEGLPL